MDVPSNGSGGEVGSVHQADAVHNATHCDQPPVNSVNDPLLLPGAVNLIDADVGVGTLDFRFFEMFRTIGAFLHMFGAIAVAIHMRHGGCRE